MNNINKVVDFNHKMRELDKCNSFLSILVFSTQMLFCNTFG